MAKDTVAAEAQGRSHLLVVARLPLRPGRAVPWLEPADLRPEPLRRPPAVAGCAGRGLTESSAAWARNDTVAAYPPRWRARSAISSNWEATASSGPLAAIPEMPGDPIRFLGLIGQSLVDQSPLWDRSEVVGDGAHQGVTERDPGSERHQVPGIRGGQVGIDSELCGGPPQGRLRGARLGCREGDEVTGSRVAAGSADG